MTNAFVSLREAKLSDLSEIQDLFANTVTAVCSADYLPEQIRVWSDSIKNIPRWIDKLNTQFFLLAESDDNTLGFISLEEGRYLDFLYVHKDFQRQGIASLLYSNIEAKAIEMGSQALIAYVSITAKPFFESKGFQAIQAQTQQLDGVDIMNYKMKKQLQNG